MGGNVLQECVDIDKLEQSGELKPVSFAMGALATKPLHTPGSHISTAASGCEQELVLPQGPLIVFLLTALRGQLGSCRQTRLAPLLPHSTAFLSFFKSHEFSQSGRLFFCPALNKNP